jgi:hypothetical protein
MCDFFVIFHILQFYSSSSMIRYCTGTRRFHFHHAPSFKNLFLIPSCTCTRTIISVRSRNNSVHVLSSRAQTSSEKAAGE